MSEVKGTIKILENKIILKTDKGTETYIKTKSVESKSWIEFRNDFYELESTFESLDDFDTEE